MLSQPSSRSAEAGTGTRRIVAGYDRSWLSKMAAKHPTSSRSSSVCLVLKAAIKRVQRLVMAALPGAHALPTALSNKRLCTSKWFPRLNLLQART